MDELRSLITNLHPAADCSCTHVVGYLARETAGGGIPTIERIAGETLTRDYSKIPKLGSEDDVFAEKLEAEQLALPKVGGRKAKRKAESVDLSSIEMKPIPVKRSRPS